MSILIGLKQDEDIRYISIEAPLDFEKITSILKNFYKTPERVKTLIDLGNLNWLGISPYTKSKGEEDLINCEAKIRDRKLSPGVHGTSWVSEEKEFIKELETSTSKVNCCFLYEDNNWFVLVGSHKESLQTADASVLKKSLLMEGLKVYSYQINEPHRDYHNYLREHTFHCWEEIRESADTDKTTYYIFREERYLTMITPNIKATA